MKRVMLIFLVFITFSILNINSKTNNIKKIKPQSSIKQTEMKALFVSYLELNTYIKNQEKEKSQKNIETIVKNTKKNNFNTIILQVRSFDDAIYKTEQFPTSKSIVLEDNTSYDVLNFFIKECKNKKIDLYIWINPFRITRENENLIEDTYAYKMKDTRVVQKVNNAYYYNPSRYETSTHIIEGIKELIKNYQFKGILFDDYFYPNNDIDSEEYQEYLNKNKEISESEYHLQTINNIIKKVYKSIKKENKSIEFGISPDGNIDNNYDKNYADVKTWCSKNGYIDFIMPQLYYGFFNTTRPYIDTMNNWDDLITNKNIKLYYALAFYKNGQEDDYAKDGKEEWVTNSDIIKKQVILARNTTNYKGFALFRYDSIFNKENYTQNTIKEFNNLKSIITE